MFFLYVFFLTWITHSHLNKCFTRLICLNENTSTQHFRQIAFISVYFAIFDSMLKFTYAEVIFNALIKNDNLANTSTRGMFFKYQLLYTMVRDANSLHMSKGWIETKQP